MLLVTQVHLAKMEHVTQRKKYYHFSSQNFLKCYKENSFSGKNVQLVEEQMQEVVPKVLECAVLVSFYRLLFNT